jgi:hypothetical protein
MRQHFVWLTATAIVTAACAWADPTAILTLESSRDGQTIAAGTTVDWTIKVAVSPGDNLGLALVLCDLVQDPANAALFEIPPGDAGSISATMDDFSRPLGVSNPGEDGAATGYIGVQRGASGQKNLIQIGGAQNTFGAAGPAGIGQDFNVNGGIGQGSLPEVVLSGSFQAPATMGTYTFRLENPAANVLTELNSPPAFCPVVAAAPSVAGASFSFTVGYARGDLNCDGVVGFGDINPFVLYLSNHAAWQATYADCPAEVGDINGDGVYPSFGDINPFVALLSGGGR